MMVRIHTLFKLFSLVYVSVTNIFFGQIPIRLVAESRPCLGNFERVIIGFLLHIIGLSHLQVIHKSLKMGDHMDRNG